LYQQITEAGIDLAIDHGVVWESWDKCKVCACRKRAISVKRPNGFGEAEPSMCEELRTFLNCPG